MTDSDYDKQQQDRVIDLINGIFLVISGVPKEEAATALTLSVVSMIIAWSEGSEQRAQSAHVFTKQVIDYINRPDIVEWIEASTSWQKAGHD